MRPKKICVAKFVPNPPEMTQKINKQVSNTLKGLSGHLEEVGSGLSTEVTPARKPLTGLFHCFLIWIYTDELNRYAFYTMMTG